MNIITKMEISKRNKERINIYIDEEYAFSISAELVYKENLKVKDKVDVQLLKKLSDEDNYIKCKNTALKIIERTYKSEKELAERLELKNAAYEMALKKYKVSSKREADEYKLMQKLYRFLMGKGYDYDLIKDVVKSIVKSEDF